jgi:hypothetical protein
MAAPKRPSVDNEVKIAERDKYIAEAEKAKAEKLKIEFDYQEAKRESSKHWWLTKNFRQQIITALIGVSLIGFYISYVVEPALKIDNIKLSLKNAIDSTTLYNRQIILNKDSIKLKKQQLHQDTLQFLLNNQKIEINRLKVTGHKIDSTAHVISAIYSNVHLNQNKLNAAKRNITGLDSTFKKQTQKLDNLSSKAAELGLILVLHRTIKTANSTIGVLSINGNFFCYTLEPTDRGLTSDMTLAQIAAITVPDKTAIPTGIYSITRYFSPKNNSTVPLLENVPGFGYVKILQGNFPIDTDGSILLGITKGVDFVGNTKEAIGQFYSIFFKALDNGENVNIKIE